MTTEQQLRELLETGPPLSEPLIQSVHAGVARRRRHRAVTAVAGAAAAAAVAVAVPLAATDRRAPDPALPAPMSSSASPSPTPAGTVERRGFGWTFEMPDGYRAVGEVTDSGGGGVWLGADGARAEKDTKHDVYAFGQARELTRFDDDAVRDTTISVYRPQARDDVPLSADQRREVVASTFVTLRRAGQRQLDVEAGAATVVPRTDRGLPGEVVVRTTIGELLHVSSYTMTEDQLVALARSLRQDG